jgi:hypothetical protein
MRVNIRRPAFRRNSLCRIGYHNGNSSKSVPTSLGAGKLRAFKVVALTRIVERTFAWLARNRRLSKDYELKVQTSEAFIDLAAIRLMLKRLAPR